MSDAWDLTLRRLKTYPPDVNRFLPPCPADRIKAVEATLGSLPRWVAGMLKDSNGAELFVHSGGPMISLFGISLIPPLPPLEWAPDWYIDKFTVAWRAQGARENEWAIGMTLDGILVLCDADNMIWEWDTAERQEHSPRMMYSRWLEKVICEGDQFLRA